MNRAAEIQPAMDVAEAVNYTFDFSADLASGVTIASAVVTCLFKEGTADATPQDLVSGSSTISSSYVIQRIAAKQAGTTYSLRCVATLSNGEKLTRAGILPVVLLG